MKKSLELLVKNYELENTLKLKDKIIANLLTKIDKDELIAELLSIIEITKK